MILYDKPYIRTPKDNVSLMHYLSLTQFISILKEKHLIFSTSQLYKDQREGSLTDPSYNETFKSLLWEDNTPVKKDDGYSDYKEKIVNSKLYEMERKHTRHWADSFGYLMREFVRYFMFTHCWSLSDDESILMWDRYRFHKPTLAIKTTLERIGNAIKKAPVYIGEINYVNYQNEHIIGYERFTEKNLTDKETIEQLFYQPFLHKQKCYKDENEVRLIISYEDVTQRLTGGTYITDIPFYNQTNYKDFGFDTSLYSIPSTNPKRFTKEDGKDIDIQQNITVGVDTDELIEQIIISPYAEDYDLNVVRSIAEKYGFNSNKIVNSPIYIKV